MNIFLYVSVGVLLLLLVSIEVYNTILHSRGRTGFISETINRSTWSVALWIAMFFGRERRHRILNKIGPVLLPLLVLVLVLLLLAGFAFIYYPFMPQSFEVSEAASQSPNWINSLYFSGVTLLTIGYGDVTPRTLEMRAIALIEGGSGFAVISLVVSYLITVYRALERKREIGLSFYHQAEEGADVSSLIKHHFVAGKFCGLDVALSSAVRDIHEMNESHFEHPVIHYFHPVEVYRNMPRTLFIMLEMCAVVRSCLNPQAYPETYDCPDIRTLETTSRYVLKNLVGAQSLDCEVSEAQEPTPKDVARWQKRWRQTFDSLAEAGIELRAEREISWKEYRKRRADWEKQLKSFAKQLGYDWNEVSGDYDLHDAESEGVKELGTEQA